MLTHPKQSVLGTRRLARDTEGSQLIWYVVVIGHQFLGLAGSSVSAMVLVIWLFGGYMDSVLLVVSQSDLVVLAEV